MAKPVPLNAGFLDICKLLDIFEFESLELRKDGKFDYQGSGVGAAEGV